MKRKAHGDTLWEIAQLPGHIFIHAPLVPCQWWWAMGGRGAWDRSRW